MALTEMVIMPGEDYQAICNSVRVKTGGTELLKSGEVAPAIDGIEINTGTDTSDATAEENDIAYGKTAYVNEERIEGTIPVESYIDTNAYTWWDSNNKRFNLYSFPEERVIIGTQYQDGEYINSDLVDLYCPGSKLGNATVNDVIQGKTFASENGIRLNGTIPLKTETDFTVENGVIIIPAGFYSSDIIKTDSNLIAENIKKGTTIFGMEGQYEGTKASSLQGIVPQITVDSNGLITAEVYPEKAIYDLPDGLMVQKQLDIQTATATPKSTSQTIKPEAGKFLSSVTVLGDSDLVASNIKSGVDIFGVIGTLNSLPNRIVNMTSGSFTPTNDISGNYYITHGLGSNADFFMVWPSVIPSNYYGTYLRFTCGFSDQNVFTNVESFESAYLVHWYSDGSGHYCSGVYWHGAINFSTSFPVTTTNNSLSLKSGVTYHWIAGTLA